MDFESKDSLYSVSEFFEKFQNEFPKIVKVAQGFCGEIVTDTFDIGQVIRVHKISRQQRVLAVTSEVTRQRAYHYSIPEDYPLKFCVKKKGKVGKEQTLTEIMKKNTLPMEVQFAKDESVTVGTKSVSTSHFPALMLTKSFEDVYLLGNFINNGTMDPRMVPVPLYLDQLRLALVIGIKGRNKQYWDSYESELTAIANTSLKYDVNYGRKDIAVYSENFAEDALYQEIQPDIYADAFQLFRKMSEAQPVPFKQEGRPKYPSVEDTTIKLKEELDITTLTRKGNNPPPVPPKPNRIQENNLYTEIPIVPSNISGRSNKTVNLNNASDSGFPAWKSGPSVKEKTTQGEKHNKLPDEIDMYTINDVSEALGELRLQKYVTAFQDEMINGTILKQLDEDFLKEEFKFTRIEALRLMTFISEGHIPK